MNCKELAKECNFFNKIYFVELKIRLILHRVSEMVRTRKQNGAVVQLVRITACHAVGRGFESRPHRKRKTKSHLRVALVF